MFSRRAGDLFFAGLTRAALGACLAILGFLLCALLWQGAKAISLPFLLTSARDFGAAGGILYQIIGSLILVITAAVLVVPVALGAALYRAEYAREATRKWIDLGLYSLNAIPSVTYGIFGLIFFVNVLGTGISWLVGGVILAIMMIPTVTLATAQAMDGIAADYRENARALGLSNSEVLRSVVLPQSLHGLVTGVLIGLARAIGETAPIMFIATAFSGVTVPRSVYEPVAALPTHILALAQQASDPSALRNAWGASLTLVSLVAILSLLALFARAHLSPYQSR